MLEMLHLRLVLLALAVALTGCGQEGAPVRQDTEMSNDSSEVAKMLPMVGAFTSVLWTECLKHDNSGGLVPGPSEYAYEGIAYLPRTAVSQLMSDYSWSESETPTISPSLRKQSGFGEGKLLEGWMRSSALEARLPSMAPYHGRVYLKESQNTIYFALSRN
jgi:hypothetical protein